MGAEQSSPRNGSRRNHRRSKEGIHPFRPRHTADRSHEKMIVDNINMNDDEEEEVEIVLDSGNDNYNDNYSGNDNETDDIDAPTVGHSGKLEIGSNGPAAHFLFSDPSLDLDLHLHSPSSPRPPVLTPSSDDEDEDEVDADHDVSAVLNVDLHAEQTIPSLTAENRIKSELHTFASIDAQSVSSSSIPPSAEPALQSQDTLTSSLSLESPLPLPNASHSFSASNPSISTTTSSAMDSFLQSHGSIVDVYQTDRTIVLDDHGQDVSDHVFNDAPKRHRLCKRSNIQLPFRECTRKGCNCSLHAPTKEVITNPIPSRPRSPPKHRRDRSDDLDGLWIPIQIPMDAMEANEEQFDPPSSESASRVQWMPKSHSERNLAVSCLEHVLEEEDLDDNMSAQGSCASEPISHQRHDTIAPLHVWMHPENTARTPHQSFATSTSELAEPSSKSQKGSQPRPPLLPAKSVSSLGGNGAPRSRAHSERRLRCDDLVLDADALLLVGTGASEGRKNSVDNHASARSRAYRRLRSRSEDVIDSHVDAQGQHTIVFEHAQNQPDQQPQPSRSRTYSDVLTSPPPPPPPSNDSTLGDEPLCLSKFTCEQLAEYEERAFPKSPTSVIQVQETSSSSSTLVPEPIMASKSTVEVEYETALKEYRRVVETLKLQGAAAAFNVVEVYHSMAWLHFQHSRFNAALCVIDHALDRLYRTQESCLTLNDALRTLSQPHLKVLLAQLLITKARILQSLANGATSGDTMNCSAQSKSLAKTALSLVEPIVHDIHCVQFWGQERHNAMLLEVAKGLLILGQCYASNNSKPEGAMDCYQQALSMFRYIGSFPSKSPPVYSDMFIAETVFHIGNLHQSQNMMDLAKDAYWEALRLYRGIHHYQMQMACRGHPLNAAESHESSLTCVLDLASTLANLGWIHLMENELGLAQQSTMEAMWLLQHYRQSGAQGFNQLRPLRNLALVEYQLGMIACRRGQWDRANQWWKTTLFHQRELYHDEGHADVATTMEAIGSCNHILGRWKTAQKYLEGAMNIHRQRRADLELNPEACWTASAPPMASVHLDIARVQSRLAVVVLQRGDQERASKYVNKAFKAYQKYDLPIDELAFECRQRLLQTR